MGFEDVSLNIVASDFKYRLIDPSVLFLSWKGEHEILMKSLLPTGDQLNEDNSLRNHDE